MKTFLVCLLLLAVAAACRCGRAHFEGNDNVHNTPFAFKSGYPYFPGGQGGDSRIFKQYDQPKWCAPYCDYFP
uniref:Secreted protein n=1 Tax=Steinernema glaseri TaxID=37863 RepID=A0A1I8ALL9_9BILA